MKNKTDFFIGLTLLAFCCVMGYEIHLIPEPAALDFFSAGSFPTGVTIALALLSLILVGLMARKEARRQSGADGRVDPGLCGRLHFPRRVRL